MLAFIKIIQNLSRITNLDSRKVFECLVEYGNLIFSYEVSFSQIKSEKLIRNEKLLNLKK